MNSIYEIHIQDGKELVNNTGPIGAFHYESNANTFRPPGFYFEINLCQHDTPEQSFQVTSIKTKVPSNQQSMEIMCSISSCDLADILQGQNSLQSIIFWKNVSFNGHHIITTFPSVTSVYCYEMLSLDNMCNVFPNLKALYTKKAQVFNPKGHVKFDKLEILTICKLFSSLDLYAEELKMLNLYNVTNSKVPTVYLERHPKLEVCRLDESVCFKSIDSKHNLTCLQFFPNSSVHKNSLPENDLLRLLVGVKDVILPVNVTRNDDFIDKLSSLLSGNIIINPDRLQYTIGVYINDNLLASYMTAFYMGLQIYDNVYPYQYVSLRYTTDFHKYIPTKEKISEIFWSHLENLSKDIFYHVCLCNFQLMSTENKNWQKFHTTLQLYHGPVIIQLYGQIKAKNNRHWPEIPEHQTNEHVIYISSRANNLHLLYFRTNPINNQDFLQIIETILKNKFPIEILIIQSYGKLFSETFINKLKSKISIVIQENYGLRM